MSNQSVENQISRAGMLAYRLRKEGKEDEYIISKLYEEGFGEEIVQRIMAGLHEEQSRSNRYDGLWEMILGGMFFLAGLLITVITYFMAEGGGKFFIAWGLMLCGIIGFVRGFTKRRKSRSHLNTRH